LSASTRWIFPALNRYFGSNWFNILLEIQEVSFVRSGGAIQNSNVGPHYILSSPSFLFRGKLFSCCLISNSYSRLRLLRWWICIWLIKIFSSFIRECYRWFCLN
jgi:hypothetical protein